MEYLNVKPMTGLDISLKMVLLRINEMDIYNYTYKLKPRSRDTVVIVRALENGNGKYEHEDVCEAPLQSSVPLCKELNRAYDAYLKERSDLLKVIDCFVENNTVVLSANEWTILSAADIDHINGYPISWR